MAESRRSRKRQTRLSFTPLPSSSPAAKGYNKQIQERAAAVTLNSSPAPAKRRRIDRSGVPQFDGVNDAPPTPAASNRPLQAKVTDDDSDSESDPVRSTQRQTTQTSALPSTNRRRRQQQQQRQLDFSNARDPDSFSSPIKLSSPSRLASARAGMFSSQVEAVVDISSDESDVLPSPRKLVTRSHVKSPGIESKSERKKNTGNELQRTTVDSDDDDNIIVGNGQAESIAIPSESEDDDDDDDDDDMPTTAGTQRRMRKRVQASPDSFVASSSPPQPPESDDDDLEIIEPPKKRRRRNLDQQEDDGDDDDHGPQTPRRRLQPRGKMTKQDKEDLEEDLDFLGPSSDVEKSARKARDSRTTAQNARLKALEALKRRRQSSQVDGAANEPEEEHEQDSELDDNDEEMPEYANPARSSQMFQEDEDDQGFIDSADEEENNLGVPENLPLEFTRYASMKAKELFKHAVEWFVQKRINPAFQMDDPIYALTFRKLDDETKGLAGSKFKSAAWTSDFTISLNARPSIAFEPIDRAENWMRDTCDACNRTNHPATFQIQFQGKPYHRETLEDVTTHDDDDDEEEEEEEDDDDDEVAYDAQGREVPPESHIYYVGKFCMSNAQTAHALQHWRYHLNEWVIIWLTRNGYSKPEEVVRRDGWSTKKRRKYANKIVDHMEEQGVVKQLYRDYRRNIDEARDTKQGRYSGWE